MYPKYHIVIGLVASALIYLIFDITILQVSIIFLSSFLIDVDHYFWYVFRKKSINPVEATKWFFKKVKIIRQINLDRRNRYQLPVLIFHSSEFWIILIALSFLNPIFIFVLIGIIIHMIPDFLEIFHYKEPILYKVSIIYVYITNKKKKDIIELVG